MKFKKLQMLLLGAMMPMGMLASPVVVITTTAGESVEIPVEAKPKVTMDAGLLTVEQDDGSELTFLLSECPQFRFGDSDSVEGLRDQNPVISYKNKVLHLEGFQPQILVSVFSTSGNLVCQGNTDSLGTLDLDLNGQEKGIYVVKTPIVTTKLIIK